MDSLSPAEAAAAPELRNRADIPDRYKWNLADIFPGWDEWLLAYDDLELKIGAYAALQGTLAHGAERLLASYRLRDEIGQLSYKVWYFVGLRYDEDQRDNAINAKRQQVQILFAKSAQAAAWFDPELLQIPLLTVQDWMRERPELAVYRFAIEDLYRQQEHVLDEKGNTYSRWRVAFFHHPRMPTPRCQPLISSTRCSRPRPVLRSRSPTGSIERSWRPTAVRAIVPRRSRRTTDYLPHI